MPGYPCCCPEPSSCVAGFTWAASGSGDPACLTINFTDTTTVQGSTIDTWAWDFGDTNTSNVQNPSHTYAAGGTYTVSLTVTLASGKQCNTSQTVYVCTIPKPCCPNGIPRVLTMSFSHPTLGACYNGSVEIQYDVPLDRWENKVNFDYGNNPSGGCFDQPPGRALLSDCQWSTEYSRPALSGGLPGFGWALLPVEDGWSCNPFFMTVLVSGHTITYSE